MTLEKILQSQGFGSRKICRHLVLDGRVGIDDAICEDPSAEFDPEGLSFEVDDQSWQYRSHVYIAMNKPAGVECSHRPQHHPSVFSLLPPQLVARGVQCVGRLDFDTTGLLLMSDDGGFIHTYSSPKKKLGKIYRITTKHAVTAEQLEALRSGVLLHDESEPISALECREMDTHVIDMTIAEGKYHQVKRMIAAAGNRVEQLHRIAVASYVLEPTLAPGAWQWLEAPLALVQSQE